MKKKIKILLIIVGVITAMFLLEKDQKRRSAVISVYVHGTLLGWQSIISSISGMPDLGAVPPGLTLVKDLEKDAIARRLAADFCKKDSGKFVWDKFYAFGWSGKLSFEARKDASKIFADQLIDLSNKHESEFGIKPIIRIVTFSHGGNVALNLANFLPKDMRIELVLIACPIQSDTERLVFSEIFSKIYVIYSMNDVLQIADPVNIYRNIEFDRSKNILSQRFFNYDLNKIKQICVSVNGTYLGHLELFNLFNKHIPAVLNRVDMLPEIKGNEKYYFDVDDPSFKFLNGMNLVDVLAGKPENIDKFGDDFN